MDKLDQFLKEKINKYLWYDNIKKVNEEIRKSYIFSSYPRVIEDMINYPQIIIYNNNDVFNDDEEDYLEKLKERRNIYQKHSKIFNIIYDELKYQLSEIEEKVNNLLKINSKIELGFLYVRENKMNVTFHQNKKSKNFLNDFSLSNYYKKKLRENGFMISNDGEIPFNFPKSIQLFDFLESKKYTEKLRKEAEKLRMIKFGDKIIPLYLYSPIGIRRIRKKRKIKS